MAQRQIQRTEFVAAFNRAFDAENIAATLARLQPLLPAIDALEIVARLGLLTWVRPEQFFRYREVVGIPPVHMQILTVAIRGALMAAPKPVPIVFNIAHGPLEGVSVSQAKDHVAVTLTRTNLDPPMDRV